MRSRNFFRGCIRPSVRPYVHLSVPPSVRPTLVKGWRADTLMILLKKNQKKKEGKEHNKRLSPDNKHETDASLRFCRWCCRYRFIRLFCSGLVLRKNSLLSLTLIMKNHQPQARSSIYTKRENKQAGLSRDDTTMTTTSSMVVAKIIKDAHF